MSLLSRCYAFHCNLESNGPPGVLDLVSNAHWTFQGYSGLSWTLLGWTVLGYSSLSLSYGIISGVFSVPSIESAIESNPLCIRPMHRALLKWTPLISLARRLLSGPTTTFNCPLPFYTLISTPSISPIHVEWNTNSLHVFNIAPTKFESLRLNT